MKRIIVLFFVLMLGSIWASAQEHTVTGVVKDETGASIPLATVSETGTRHATVADGNGNFTINMRGNGSLTISAAGYKPTTITPDGNKVEAILTTNSKELTEVMVTALGIQRTRNSLPYAAQQVSGDDLNKTITTNVVNNLSGKVAGLKITASNAMGGSTNAVLRGFKSLTQSNQALFVVDGVPYNNSITTGNGIDFGSTASDINPDDIASVSVLKGAAASALYGSRASNGVIIITTKKGLNRKGFGVTASFGISTGRADKSTLPVYQTQNGEGYGGDGAGDNGGNNPYPAFYYQPIPGVNGGNPVTIVPTNDDAATGAPYDPTLMVYNWDAFSPTDPNFHKATPWQPAANHNPTDYFVNPGTTTESILVQGGGNQGTFKFNYTRDDEKGYIPNSSITKNLFDFGAGYNITDRINIEGGVNYSNEAAINRYIYQYTAGTNPMTDFRQWWPTNVDIKAQKNDYFNSLTNATWNWQDDGSFQNNTLGSIGLPAYHDNLYWFAYQNFEADSRNRYTSHANVNYKITNFLNLTGGVTNDYYNYLIEQRNNVGSQATSYYTRQNITFSETNYHAMLNFNKNVGRNFNVKALVGANVAKDEYTSIFASTNGGLLLPSYWSVSNSKNTPAAPTEVDQRKEVNSLYAGATLSYKDMVTLDGTIRRDQSSTLPSANNTYYYPSVSANFVFSKMLHTENWLSYGKIWANYAQVGGDAPYYSTNNTYTINTPMNGQALMNIVPTNNNQNLVPELNKTYEGGLEMSFLHDRLGFSADYFHSVQSNQILPISVSTATGYNTFFVNAGSVQNEGVEITAHIVPIKIANFRWNMDINWTKQENKVLSLYGDQPSYEIAGLQNSIQLVAEVGKAYGIIRGTTYKMLDGQREISAGGNYILDPNPLSDIGSIQPKWFGGINNTFTYKNFSLSFLIDVSHGGSVYSLDMDYGSFSGLYPRTAGFNDLGKPVRAPLSDGGGIILKGVTADGKPNTTRIDESNLDNGAWTFGSLSNGEANSEFVYDASYIKLREAAITYSLPKKVMDNLHFLQGIDLSLSGRNLWIIHKNEPYADPEQGQAAGNASIGFQNGAYPVYRMFNFIIKVKF